MRVRRAFWGVEQFTDLLRSWRLEPNRWLRCGHLDLRLGLVAGFAVGLRDGSHCVAQVRESGLGVGIADGCQDAVPDGAAAAGTVTVEAGREAGGADGSVGPLALGEVDDARRRVRHDRHRRAEPEP